MRLGSLVLNFLYNRLYAELAWSYDAVSWLVSGGRWWDWQRQTLPFLRGRDVLEIGCGPGHLLAETRARGYRVVGVDRSAAMWRRAARHGTVVAADARALPFAPASFDSILLTFPAGYIYGVAFWSELAHALRPGGQVVILEGASSATRFWPGPLERFTGWLSGTPTNSSLPDDANAVVALPVAGFLARRVALQGPWGTVVLLLAERLPAR